MFGEQDVNFNQARICQWFDNIHSDAEFRAATERAQAYIRTYFAWCIRPGGILYHIPTENTIERVIPTNIATYLVSTDFEYRIGGAVALKWNPQRWFMKEVTERVVLTFDPTESRTFERRGQAYINLWRGYLHDSVTTTFDEYPLEVQRAVMGILDHIKQVWCSGDATQARYVERWLAQVAQKLKCTTLLFGTSGQGWGKSIITDFLWEYVFGRESTIVCEDADSLVGDFNSLLKSKTLVVVEEAPAASRAQWSRFYDKLKQAITGKTLTLKEKYQSSMTVDNYTCWMMFSNNQALRLDADDRRVVFLEMSDARKGDHAYFRDLMSHMTSETGEAFFQYLRGIDLEAFDDQRDRPITRAKTEHIADHLPSVIQFVKDTYVLRNVGIEGPFGTLYDRYEQWSREHDRKPLGKNLFSRTMKTELGLKTTRRRVAGCPCVCADMGHADLLRMYQGRRWVTEMDDIELPDEVLEDAPAVLPPATGIPAVLLP